MNQDPRFTDLMQEIKERLYTIDDVLSGRTALQGPLAHEFCFLQLRMICECICYACVIAHAYIEELREPKFQRQWSADSLMKSFEKLHEEFYPKPKTISVTDSVIRLDEIEAPYLTKGDLKKLNGLCGDRLHRGSPEKYSYNPTKERLAEDRQLIIDFANKVFRLMESYLLSNRDMPRYILCRFGQRNVPVEVWFAAAPDPVTNCE